MAVAKLASAMLRVVLGFLVQVCGLLLALEVGLHSSSLGFGSFWIFFSRFFGSTPFCSGSSFCFLFFSVRYRDSCLSLVLTLNYLRSPSFSMEL